MCAVVLIVLTACDKEQNIKADQAAHFGNGVEYDQREQLLLQFIETKLSSEDGMIYTNYVDSEQNEQVATGHEVLSESMGLAMRYYARAGLQEAFQNTLTALNDHFNLDSGYSYRYSPKHDEAYTVNAAVDDLRVIRALYEAVEQFGNDQYKQYAEQLATRFFSHNVSDERLHDFYDDSYDVHNNFITLCYVDLRTLKLMDYNNEHSKLIQAMTEHIHNGYISDEFPFYETRYMYDEGVYQSEDINTIESLLTILSLVEVDQHKAASIDFIKERVERGELFGRYSHDGKPLTDVQSTAIYAITAMIGSELGDQPLYEASINRMEQYQILQNDHELYGAYGNSDSLQVFSFDNLQALLAYTY